MPASDPVNGTPPPPQLLLPAQDGGGTLNGGFEARSSLISRAEATGNSRATLPLATSSDGREVGALNGLSVVEA